MERRVDNTREYDIAVMKINSFLKRGLTVDTTKIVSDVEKYLEISMFQYYPEFKAELIKALDEALARVLRR